MCSLGGRDFEEGCVYIAFDLLCGKLFVVVIRAANRDSFDSEFRYALR